MKTWRSIHLYSLDLDNWYAWDGRIWQLSLVKTIEHEILTEIKMLDPQSVRTSLISDVYNLMAISLQGSLGLPPKNALNFRNGILDLTSMQLIPHDPEYLFTYIIDLDYDHDAYPDEVLQKLLLYFVDGNIRMLNILRGSFRRAIEPSGLFQTAIWLVGPPASGKSTIISWIRYVIQNRCVELNCTKTNQFDKGTLIGANCITISDGELINNEVARLLKTIVGRDTITYDYKYKQTRGNFVSEAVLFVTSNLDLASAMTNVHDAGLLDRFIEIPFPNAALRPIPGLLNYLQSNTPALINWALAAPREALVRQVRVGFLDPKTLLADPFLNFIMSSLCPDENGFVGALDLTNKADAYFHAFGVRLSPMVKRSLHVKMTSLLNKYFNLRVKEIRRQNIRGIQGVRFLEPKDRTYFSL